jgi:hypothetical protein
MNRVSRTWSLAKEDEQGRMETGQSLNYRVKIRWALNTVRPFKLAGTDGIVPALVQHEAELVIPKICRKLEQAWHFFLSTWPRGKLR